MTATNCRVHYMYAIFNNHHVQYHDWFSMHEGLQLRVINTCMIGDLYQTAAYCGITVQANQLSNQHPQGS